MTAKIKLHIVAFNVPYPANYGGVIDIFFKVKALWKAGAKIHLHCFQYGRGKQPILDKYCEKVYYYKRGRGVRHAFKSSPYIVATRNNPELLENLCAVKAPIIFEGLHTCYFLGHPLLEDYTKIIRMHNIEHDYYNGLARAESNIFRKVYFRREATKLKQFESEALKKADLLLAISPSDQRYFEQIHPKSYFMPAFHSHEKVLSKRGKGDYILFHGNLGVAENQKSVLFLIQQVLSDEKYPTIIAGMDPPKKLRAAIKKYRHIKIVANPAAGKMEELISNAHICLLPTFQPTGLKLKLIDSLFAGRFCLVNSTMVKETGLEGLCIVADTPSGLKTAIKNTWGEKFSEEGLNKRKYILESVFSNNLNAQRLCNLVGEV
ncbi:MAG: glycosyltransferase family 4 protein [Chlorobi bacterium]|nr:glycosyltransferase family 4 protein [Chlorobiota bacterium]